MLKQIIHIIRTVCRVTGIQMVAMTNTASTKPIRHARYLAIHHVHLAFPGLSHAVLGQLFRRDSTCATRRLFYHEGLLASDARYRLHHLAIQLALSKDQQSTIPNHQSSIEEIGDHGSEIVDQ
jgi:hypothetical protein